MIATLSQVALSEFVPDSLLRLATAVMLPQKAEYRIPSRH
jgi:hypothetical protein